MRLETDNFAEDYPRVLARVRQGRQVATRLGTSYELADAVLVLHDPSRCWAGGAARKLSPAIAAAEALQLVGGVSAPDVLARVAPQFAAYAEDDGSYYGAYGLRVGPQLEEVVRVLTDDPDSRQAVVAIWEPRDLGQRKRDMPCTLSLDFLVRDERLELHVTMRSNDAWLGLPYDVVQFCVLQQTVAGLLGRKTGAYFHHAVSLHLYERDLARALEVVYAPVVRGESAVRLEGVQAQPGRVLEAQERARALLAGEHPGDTDTERWFAAALA